MSETSSWAAAGLWGLLVGSALLVGASITLWKELPHRVIAAVMGFGAGVLVSVLGTHLVEEAFHSGGLALTLAGFFCGAVVFSGANWLLSKRGAKDRKRCGGCVRQPTEAQAPGSGSAIAIGALLDGIPESLIIGLSLTEAAPNAAVVAGFFIANLPQGLSGASGMKQAGRGARYVLSLWAGVAAASGVAAVVGHVGFANASPEVLTIVRSFAAGGVLAMLAETMIPEAFEKAQSFIGLITAAGFLAAFSLFKLM